MPECISVDLTKDQLLKLMACLTLYDADVPMIPEKKAEHDALFDLLDDAAMNEWGVNYGL